MKKAQSGFTLAELLIVVWILAIVIVGMVQLFIYTAVQAKLAGNQTAAISEAQNKIEEIRTHTYANIVTDYGAGGTPGNTFNLSLLTGKGIVTIDSSNAELLTMTIKACWRDKYNRIVGEDKNLNGQLDSGEDANGNGVIDSPVTLMSMITRR